MSLWCRTRAQPAQRSLTAGAGEVSAPPLLQPGLVISRNSAQALSCSVTEPFWSRKTKINKWSTAISNTRSCILSPQSHASLCSKWSLWTAASVIPAPGTRPCRALHKAAVWEHSWVCSHSHNVLMHTHSTNSGTARLQRQLQLWHYSTSNSSTSHHRQGFYRALLSVFLVLSFLFREREGERNSLRKQTCHCMVL